MVSKTNLLEAVNKGMLYEYIQIGTLNNHMLNVVQVADRTLDFHVHNESDELFYCIEGSFSIEFEDGLIDLKQGDVVIVPKGTLHRPVCTSLNKCLLIDMCGALNNDNCGGSYN